MTLSHCPIRLSHHKTAGQDPQIEVGTLSLSHLDKTAGQSTCPTVPYYVRTPRWDGVLTSSNPSRPE